MNDDDTLAAVRSSLTSTKDALAHVRMDQPPEAILARARGRRLRRVLPGVGAGGLALGLGLALSLSGGHPAGSAGSGTASAASPGVHVNLAAWSVNTMPTGLVNVTLRELRDPAQLRSTLAEAGVPVVLTSSRVCTSDDKLEVSKVVRKVTGDDGLAITIDPSAMPAGTELVIGIGTFHNGSQHGPAAAFGLAQKGSPLSCSGGTKTLS
jgi:hypothetical protein